MSTKPVITFAQAQAAMAAIIEKAMQTPAQPVAIAPSPKSQRVPTTPPAGAVEQAPSTTTASPGATARCSALIDQALSHNGEEKHADVLRLEKAGTAHGIGMEQVGARMQRVRHSLTYGLRPQCALSRKSP